MKVIDIIKGQKPSLSFEVFPPKQSQNYERIWSAAEQIAALSPSYMSVTYGAGGTGAGYTVELASGLKKKGVVPLAHLTWRRGDERKDKGGADLLARGRHREHSRPAGRFTRSASPVTDGLPACL